MTPHSLLRFLCLSCFLLPLSLACPLSFPCNGLGQIQFPFTPAEKPDCGLIHITGCYDPNPINHAQFGNQSRLITWITPPEDDQPNTFTFGAQDLEFEKLLLSKSCKTFDHSRAIPSLSPMLSFQIVPNITLFKCNHAQKIKPPEGYSKYRDSFDYDIYFDPDKTYDQRPTPLNACSSITLPLNPHPNPYSNHSDPFALLTAEILIKAELSDTCFDCHYKKGGQCLPEGKFCTVDQKRKDPKAIIIGVSIGSAMAITIGLFVIIVLNKRRYKSTGVQNQSRNINSDKYLSENTESRLIYFGVPVFTYEQLQEATNNFDRSRELGNGGFGTVYYGLAAGGVFLISISFLIILWIKDQRYNWSVFLNRSRSIYFDIHPSTNPECVSVDFGVPIFSYEEIQKATHNFDPSRELGSGGFGTVYYGQLKDGREVAVKYLYQRKCDNRRVKQFMNEIQILKRLRHRNLVSLYGSTSLQSHGLLLIYEYIPNGTIASHLHGDLAKPDSLPWPVRMKIALEIASALTYLHACDVIHRDIKTNNILLDNNFCVKVADFGISRLSPNDVSHVSTAPQGTMGYVDPEYRENYQLTKKSDVYSFGVVLIELISSMQAVDDTRNIDEIKLANLAIKKIQRRAFAELVDPSLGFDSNNEFKRMIISVGELAFQCLQRDKNLRPSMYKVWEVLLKIDGGKDETESLEVHGGGIS